MPVSKEEKEFVAYVVESIQPLGAVTAKGMFGGHGLYLDGLMFGLIANSELYFKVDDQTEAEFVALELGAFGYSKNGKEYKMSYYQAPEEVFDNEESMLDWGNKAYGAALRAKSKKPKKRK